MHTDGGLGRGQDLRQRLGPLIILLSSLLTLELLFPLLRIVSSCGLSSIYLLLRFV